MSIENFKKELFNQFARIGKAISHGYRLELLEFLAQGEHHVEHLAMLMELSVANTSQHLQQLRHAGLVVARKEGQHVYYRLADDRIISLLTALRMVAEQTIAEVDKLVGIFLTVKDELEPLPAHELFERIQQGVVTVIDVRPAEEFAAGHLPHAINIPLKDLENKILQLSVEKEIIAYCRGPYCVLAYSAVAQLREHGFKARRLENGYPEWKISGLPVQF